MIARKFAGSFTQQEPLPEAAIEAATATLRRARLHRYDLLPGESGEVALLEREFAAWQGSRYCLAVTSGGQAIQIALRAAGVAPGDPVLTSAFTLAPVPGAIHAVGARPVLVEIDEDLRPDLDDLADKVEACGGKYVLLSHMRGHMCDMERLKSLVARIGLIVIEDCAHTMGATWNGARSGNFGLAGCFSTQSYKHMNSGEGGLLTSDDPDFIARATILSGSYMHHERHGAGPHVSHFARPRYEMANMSARMDALRAAILRPQLVALDRNLKRWNERYEIVAGELSGSGPIVLPERPATEGMVGSSIQFRVPDLGEAGCREVIARAGARGVVLKWFGSAEPEGFTSTHGSWGYVDPQHLPRTDRTLATLFDMRIPLTFSLEDCSLIGSIIREEVDEVCT